MRKLSSLAILVMLCGNLIAQSPHGKDFVMDCSDCHNTEGWKVDLSKINFNHDQTKFKLEGQHRQVNCKTCHKSLVFTGLGTDCISCHTDMHYQTVGPECSRCHTPKSWIVENITAIHQVSRFPLVGPHATADCYSCHPSESLLRFEPLGVTCYDCHKNKYLATTSPNHVESKYPTTCEECHLMTRFDWTGANINHSFFPLTGGHSIDCIKCHTTGVFGKLPTECVSCHQADYNATNDPNHASLQFPTDCALCHTLNPGWKPAQYTSHDNQYFPIYSGSHNGAWTSCADCHTTPGNYALFSCIDCHTHNKPDTDSKHGEVGGYSYNSIACYECHPSGGGGGFNHATSSFPLTGAHLTLACSACHSTQFAGTPTACYACHQTNYNQTNNPNHSTAGIATECETCHTTAPGWKPALFPQHSTIYPLTGAHAAITNCDDCHASNYVTTPNLCYGCHATTYNQTNNPNHATAQFPTTCETCHSTTAWTPATFNHDGLYFPIYSGAHQGKWTLCSDCHTNASNFAVYTCTSTCHPSAQVGPQHSDVGGYTYNDVACFECHPTGSAGGAFNHNTSPFPLTGAHATTDCSGCHANGWAGTPTICFACHETAFNQTTNPNHVAINIPNTCETCHTTNPGWQPATFPIHNTYYALTGAHTTIDCFSCHAGNYTSTTNLCYGCHATNYNQTTNPNHAAAQFPTTCETCHTTTAWTPATFNHDGLYFPIYSGAHQGKWTVCSDCHINPNNYAVYTCTGSCHPQAQTDQNHNGVGGYVYQDVACFECHPTGSAGGAFNHNNSPFPLTGAHATLECNSCHANGWAGTPTACVACHQTNYNQTTNPPHAAISIGTDCESCHTTNPGWQPATFAIHGNYFALTGAHTTVDCNSCHNGNYTTTPNTCSGCHISNYNQTTNPPHAAIGIGTDCQTCHTTNPGWQPATFAIHNTYWPLTGAHINVDCNSCHNGNYNSTPNTCDGCHMADYNGATNPNHVAAGFPTTCEMCHTTTAWIPSTFNHDGLYFPIYSGTHQGVWTLCSQCHPNPSNFAVFTCTTSCHPQSQTDPEHTDVPGYTYNSDACYSCHPTGQGGGKLMRQKLIPR